MFLFLDDIRNPKDAYIHPSKGTTNGRIINMLSLSDVSGIPNGNWEIVRSYQEFVDFINSKGIPMVVSFDHDLTRDCMNLYVSDTIVSGIIEYDNIPKRTGWHCAKFLKEYCESENKPFPKYFIHSANEYGAENIKKLIENEKP